MKISIWLVVGSTMLLWLGDPRQLVAQEAAAAQVQTAPVELSTAAGEVVRLAGAGVGDDVVLAYIQNSQAPFNLGAEGVLYLKDVGISSAIISAMLAHDTNLRNQSVPVTPVTPVTPVQEPVQEVPATDATYVSDAPADVTYFYSALSPYGAWLDLAGVGWCWQPRTVFMNRNWSPYCDNGRWLYSDAGWYWQSDYSWGWAPFHYGRWYLDERSGWVWVPDRTWGPAWVVWRYEDDNCGWAPLPPRAVFDARAGWRFKGATVGVGFDFGLRPQHYTFVNMRDFTQRDIGRHRLPPDQAQRIYRQSTVVNNYVVNNRTIVNRGIPVDRVAAVTHTDLRPAHIRDLPPGQTHDMHRETVDRNGPVILRPQLGPPPSKPPIVHAQKVDAQHPTVYHPPLVPVTTTSPRYGTPPTTSRPGTPPTTGPSNPRDPRTYPPMNPNQPGSNYRPPGPGNQPPNRPATTTKDPRFNQPPNTDGKILNSRPPSGPPNNSQFYSPKTYQPAPPSTPRGSTTPPSGNAGTPANNPPQTGNSTPPPPPKKP